MWQQIHIRPSFLSLTRAPDLRKTTADLKRAYLDNWNHPVDAWCTPTVGNHQKLFFVPYTNSCLYIRLFFFHCRDFQIVPLHILMLAANTWRSLENLDLHCSGMLCSLTLELATDMLYNHGINSLSTMISPTAMRSPSITDIRIKYGKLSSVAVNTGMIVTLNKFGTFKLVLLDNSVYLSCFSEQFVYYVNILSMFNLF